MQALPVALVSGVGPGTGAAIARRFARGGYAVAHLCLLNDDELDVRSALRSGRGDALDEVARILQRAVGLKPTGHHLLDGRSTRERSMYQIGG